MNLRALPPGEEPDFLALSRSTAANLLLKYGFVLRLALAVGWWHQTAGGETRQKRASDEDADDFQDGGEPALR